MKSKLRDDYFSCFSLLIALFEKQQQKQRTWLLSWRDVGRERGLGGGADREWERDTAGYHGLCPSWRLRRQKYSRADNTASYLGYFRTECYKRYYYLTINHSVVLVSWYVSRMKLVSGKCYKTTTNKFCSIVLKSLIYSTL